MRRNTALVAIVLAGILGGLVGDTAAQGVQYGTIRGTVTDPQGLPIPSVTVTATSPSMQGPRTTATGPDGSYSLLQLPSGTYELAFETTAFSPAKRTTAILLGLTVEQNVQLQTAGVTEQIQVTAASPAPIATATVGANYKHDEIDALPTQRTLAGIAQLAPGLTENTPNTGQITINGALSFDNVFMLNGVDVNDNLFGTSAEPLHRGCNRRNPDHHLRHHRRIRPVHRRRRQRRDQERRQHLLRQLPDRLLEPELDQTNAVRDLRPRRSRRRAAGRLPRVWTSCKRPTRERWAVPSSGIGCGFSAQPRYAETSNSASLPISNLANTQTDTNKRGEIKLTSTLVQNHTIQGGYLNNAQDAGQPAHLLVHHRQGRRRRPHAAELVRLRELPRRAPQQPAGRGAVPRRGSSDSGDNGGTATNIVDSPFIDAEPGELAHFNAQYFDATDPENRNNGQFTGNVTYFVQRAGRHEFKSGYEFFRSQLTGGNSQSSTGYVFDADWAEDAGGAPLLDSDGRLIPVFVPGETLLENWLPSRGRDAQRR